MRDILFRGMTRKPGERVKMDGTPIPGNWVYGGIFPGDGDFSVIYQREPVEKFSVYNDTIGQYTGLCDKNGVKIFEGDIVKTRYFGKDDGNGRNFNDYDIFAVKWNNSEFCMESKTRKYSIYEDDESIEVIGNIHENKELLEGVHG